MGDRAPLMSLAAGFILGLAASVGAVDVTVSLATKSDEETVPVDQLQALWKSPFGGWVVTTWPFGLRVDDQPICGYRTGEQKLIDQATGGGLLERGNADKTLDGLLDNGRPAISADLRAFRLDRPSSATLDLLEGEHTIHPFGIVFAVSADGRLSSPDQRVRIDQDERRVEVLCHAVTLRTTEKDRSVAAPLRFAVGTSNALTGLDVMLAEFARTNEAAAGVSPEDGFLRLTLYLPPSTPGTGYTVNDVPFKVDAGGSIVLADTAQARCIGTGELCLVRTPPVVAETQTVGMCWSGEPKGIEIASGGGPFSSDATAGSIVLRVPLTGQRHIRIGPRNVRFPDPDGRFPHGMLIWNGATQACWFVETPGPLCRPGVEYTCRILPLTDSTPDIGQTFPLRLVSESVATTDETMVLKAQGDGVYAGPLPSVLGLWRLYAADGPLRDQACALVSIAEEGPVAAVSFFTVRNRALFRRGDVVNVLWNAKRPDDSSRTEWPVLLRANGIETVTALIAGAAGCLQIDTTGFAPGDYEITTDAPQTASYPFRFRVCQREPVSDFELYSYVFGQASPCGGSPVNAYCGGRPLTDEPGLAPFLADTNGSFSAVLASYADAALGPAEEKFLQPSAEETTSMALAGLGVRAAPNIPTMLHHEEWNPKHTLPEELARLQRRLALFVQPRADVPGFGGLALNWYATLKGYWEESPRLDGHQNQRNAEADKWIAGQVEKCVDAAKGTGVGGKELGTVRDRARVRFASSVLANAYSRYLADARAICPDLTAHSGIPSFWLGGGNSHPAYAYASLTHRDSVDYTDYGISPWGNFRAPAFMNMGNPDGDKLRCNFAAAGRHSRIATVFGAVGRGLDGVSLKLDSPYPAGEDAALLRMLERFGSYFSALDPLPDVAVYFNGWPQQKSVVLHDLARMRRPGMLLSPEDVIAGKLARYRVLFLAGVGQGEPTEALDTFRAFETRGGVILKDQLCAVSLPGRDIGFAYDRTHVHNGWGLAYPNGEWEFAHLWKNFKETREKHLVAAFTGVPGIPVTTPDADVVISPLAGRESICCFVINQTLVPLSVEGKWRQHAVLPRTGELLIDDGWYVRDLLRGTEASVEETPAGRRIAVDFARMEGAVYLLTRRRPATMAISATHSSPSTLRLAGWLADAGGKPLTDPMPFDVTLRRSDGTILFRKYAALAPERSLDVPVPTLIGGDALELHVQDLVLGQVATRRVTVTETPGTPSREAPDLVGGQEHIAEFLTGRPERVTILLDEGQTELRPAAERLAGVLRRSGRDVRTVVWDPADVHPLPLRWHPTDEDEGLLTGLRTGTAFAWRVDMNPWIAETDRKGRKTILFDDPRCGYVEYGPRLRIDSDVVLFGAPDTHRALKELKPFLRRVPTRNTPGEGGFFVHHLWSPFRGGHNGLYLGCRDPQGALAAVDCLADLATVREGRVPPERTQPDAGPATPAESVAPLEDMVTGKFGTRILDIAFAPGGNRVFATTESYGDSFFALTASGEIEAKRALHNRCGNSLWSRSGGRLQAIDDRTVRVSVGGTDYHYSLDDGWLSKVAIPGTGFTGRFRVPVAASTLLRDAPRGRAFLGGMLEMQALDDHGNLLWAFDDTTVHTTTDDLLYPRALFPRAVSGDGRVLLVAGFGIKHDCYSIGQAVNASVLGLDTSNGKLLWKRDGTLLNEGKAIPLTSRFLVADDTGGFRVMDAASGNDGEPLGPIASADWMLPVPGRDELLIVENNTFDRHGPVAQVYVRPLGDAPDRVLPAEGRVTDALVASDGGSVTLATDRGIVVRFGIDGDELWRASVPSGGILRPTSDGKAILVGARDGVLYWFATDSGECIRRVDLNPFNTTTGERFERQLHATDGVPSHALTAPHEPLEPSYLATLDPGKVSFGPNLLPPERVRPDLAPADPAKDDPAEPAQVGRLAPGTSFTLPVEEGNTYLVELLAASADPAQLTPRTRLDVSISGGRKGTNLPVHARFPLSRLLARKRLAFRADESGTVTLRLRAVEPRQAAGGKKATATYEDAADSAAGLLAADIVVAAIRFRGPNLLLEDGPAAKREPVGVLTCEVKPWTGGNSTVRWQPYPCPQAALRCVDGVLANQETAWTTEARGAGVAYAEGRVRFRRPQTLTAIAVYEDTSGPVPATDGLRETVATTFGVYIRDANTHQLVRMGRAIGNSQFVSIFECPAVQADEILYFRAGRDDTSKTDGVVRLAEIEAYSDDIAGMLDDVIGDEDGLLKLE